MPEVARSPLRMDCPLGLNLVDVPDRMREGSFPYLFNVRVLEEGTLEGRPGYTQYGSVTGIGGSPNLLHSIRRLNDPDNSHSASGYEYIVGNGTTLDAGTENALVQIDAGYSGNPLSILTFRPEQSPESWAYVYDANKQSKVDPGGMLRPIGVAPPTTAPTCEYGVPANVDITTGQDATGWTATQSPGSPPVPGTSDRAAGSTPTILGIIYDTGSTGWCCINPAIAGGHNYGWAASRMKVILQSGSEEVLVREVHPPIASTTIASIAYDSGSTGLCCIVLTKNPSGIDRNSLIKLNSSETVRVLSVTYSPDGSTYSIRCSTAGTFSATQTVDGLESWYTYTVANHAAGETIVSNYIGLTGMSGSGTQSMYLPTTPNAGITSNNRTIDPANDYLSVGLLLVNPENVVNVQLLVNFDATPNYSFSNPGNSWIWTITQSELLALGVRAGGTGVNLNWADIQIPLSSGTQYGNPELTFANITGIAIQLTVTGVCGWGFDWWYFFGTYGPVIQPNAPTGYFYSSTLRDPDTGAFSVPGPSTRFSMYPLREDVLVTPQAVNVSWSPSAYCDVYRQGGTITDYVYAGSVVNNFVTPNALDDTLSDLSVSGNATVDLTQLQPWPVLGNPLTGLVSVTGTSVTWVAGDKFPVSMVNNTVILLNGVAYETRGNPKSATFLELQLSAGVQTCVYTIASPTLAGQALPLAFGPLEGPLAPVAFALGDPVNAGTLYFSNTSNLDSSADTNTLEITSPTEPLITGEVWNGLAFVGSRDNVFLVRYSFLASQGGTPYQFQRLPGGAGFWSRWAICRGPNGIYALGRDGIYLWNESGGKSISDSMLNSIFPQDGQPAKGQFGVLPVDMTQTSFMRLSYTDDSIRFTYIDTGGNQVTLRYEVGHNRWFQHFYGDPISYEYLDELSVGSPNFPQILYLSKSLGLIYKAGGNTDNGVAIGSLVQTPYIDGGDFRSQKLPIDYMVDAEGTGTLDVAMFFDSGISNTASTPIVFTGSRMQTPVAVSSVPGNLALYRNVSVKFSWTGGPNGIRIIGTEPSWYTQAYLSTNLDTQYFGLSFPGWKFARRALPAVISTSPVTFLIRTQDGRSYSIVIPSTGGQLLQQPIMLPQTCKSLMFAFQCNAGGSQFAVFPDEFVVEFKEWSEPSFVKLAVFKA